MSQENVGLARRSIDAISRHDLSAYLDLMDDEIEAVSRLSAIEGESTAAMKVSAAGGRPCSILA